MKLPTKYRLQIACNRLNMLTSPSRMETDERWRTLKARARRVRSWLRSNAIEGRDWIESDSGRVWCGDAVAIFNGGQS